MLKELTVWVLNQYFRRYVENLNVEQLSLGLFKGRVELENLWLKKDSLEDLELPLQLRKGYLGKIVIEIPGVQFWKQPWSISVERVYVIFGPNRNPKYDRDRERARNEERKRSQLELLETQWRERCEREPTGATSSYGKSLAYKIVENLQLTWKDVHVRYEEDGEGLGFWCAWGVTIDSLAMLNADHNWEPVPLKRDFAEGETEQKFQRKLADLKNLAVYWDTKNEAFSDLPLSELKNKMQTVATLNHDYVLRKVDANVRVLTDGRNEPLVSFLEPRFCCDFRLDEFQISLRQVQYEGMVTFVCEFEKLVNLRRYRKWRPTSEIRGHVKEWWQYLAAPLLARRALRRQTRRWPHVLRRARQNVSYVTNYAVYLLHPMDCSVQCKEQITQTEKELDFTALKILRQLAMEEASWKRSEELKILQKSNKVQKGMTFLKNLFPQWGGWNNESGADQLPERIPLSSPIEPPEEEFLESLFFPGEDESFLHRDAVFAKMSLVVLHGALRLVVDGMSNSVPSPPILELEFSDGSVVYEWRPRSDSSKLVVDLGTFRLVDRTHRGMAFPILVSSAFPSGGDVRDVLSRKPEFFSLEYEKNPPESDLEMRIRVTAEPLEVVYDATAFDRWIGFVARPHRKRWADLNMLPLLAADNAWEDERGLFIKRSDAIIAAKKWDVYLNVAAPKVVFPEDLNDKISAILVCDFGRLGFYSGLSRPCVGNTDDNHGEDVCKKMADAEFVPSVFSNSSREQNGLSGNTERFYLELSGLKLVLWKSMDSWKQKDEPCAEDCVVEPFSISFQLERHFPSTDEYQQPKLMVTGALPILSVHVSEKKIAAIMSCLRELHSSMQWVTSTSYELGMKDRDKRSFDNKDGTSLKCLHILVVEFNLDQLLLHVQSKGKDLVKMNINSVESTFKSTPSNIAASFTVQSLFVTDEQRTFGSEHPFLMALRGMDCAEEEKFFVFEVKRHEPVRSPDSSSVGSDVMTTASISFKNLDVVVNQEVVVEVMGLLELVFVGQKSSLQHRNGDSLTSAASNSEDVTNVVDKLLAQTKMSFECNKLSLLLLTACCSNGIIAAKEVASMTLTSVRVNATTGSTLTFEGSLGGCHVKHFDSERVEYQCILSFGYDPSLALGDLPGESEEALSFSIAMPIQLVNNEFLDSTAESSVALRMALLIYCHSSAFFDDLVTFGFGYAPDIFDKSSMNASAWCRPDFTKWVSFPKTSMAAVSGVLRQILIRRDDELSNSIEANNGPTTIELDVLIKGLRMTLPLSASCIEMLEVDLGQISLTGRLPPELLDATFVESPSAPLDRDGFVRGSFALRSVNFCSAESGSDSNRGCDADSSAWKPSNANGTRREPMMEGVAFQLSVNWRFHPSDREPSSSLQSENSSSPSTRDNRTTDSRVVVDVHGWFEKIIKVRSSKDEYRKMTMAIRHLMGSGEDRTTFERVSVESISEEEEDAGHGRKEDSVTESTVSVTNSVLRCLFECPQLVVELIPPMETESDVMRLAVTNVILDCETSDFMISKFALTLQSVILEDPLVAGRTIENASGNTLWEGATSSERKPRKFLEVSATCLTVFVVDRRCEDFSSTYNSTDVFMDLDVQRIDLGMNLNTWKAIVAFFGSGPESVLHDDEELEGASSRTVRRRPWEAFSECNVELEAKLGAVGLVLRRAEFDLAEVMAENIESRASLRGDRCAVRGTLTGLLVRDASPNAGLYEERFSIVGHNPLAFCIVAGKWNSVNEGRDYAADLTLDFPSCRCIHVHRFFTEWMAFVDEFLAVLSDLGDEPLRSVLRLNVFVDSSTLALPVHLASSELLVVELGTSKLANELVETDSSETIGRTTSSDRAVDGNGSTSKRRLLDDMNVELLTCDFFVGVRIDPTSHLESGAEDGRWDFGHFVISRRGPPLLKETYEKLCLQLKRNVSKGTNPSLPDVAVGVKWNDVCVSLDLVQYGTVFRVLDRNLMENVEAAVDAKDVGTRFSFRMCLEKTTLELRNGSRGPSEREIPRFRLVFDEASLTVWTGYDLLTTVESTTTSVTVEDFGVRPEHSLVLLRPIVSTRYGRPRVALRYQTSGSGPGKFWVSFRSMRVALGWDGWTRLSAFLRAPLEANGVSDVKAMVENLGVDLRRRADRWARAFVVGARVWTSGDPSAGDFDATGSVGRLTFYDAASRDPLYEERLCFEGREPATFRLRQSEDSESGEANRFSASFALHVPASIRYVHAGEFTDEILDYFREVARRRDADETTGHQEFQPPTPWHLVKWEVHLDEPVLVLPARPSSGCVLVVDLRRVTMTDAFPETVADDAALPAGFGDPPGKEEPLGQAAYIVLEGVGATLGDRVDRESSRRAELEGAAVRFGSYGIRRMDVPFLEEGARIYLKRVSSTDANPRTTIDGHARGVHGSILAHQYRVLSDVARSFRQEDPAMVQEEAEGVERRSRLSLSLDALDSSLALRNSEEASASTAVHFGHWRVTYEGFSEGAGEVAFAVDDLRRSESGLEDSGAEDQRSASPQPSALRVRYDGSTDVPRMSVKLTGVRLSAEGWSRLTEWARVAALPPPPGEDCSTGAVTFPSIDVRIDGAEIRVVERSSVERYDVTLDTTMTVTWKVSGGAVARVPLPLEPRSLGDVAGEPAGAVRFDLRCRSELSKVSLKTTEGDLAQVTLTRWRFAYSEWVDHLWVSVRVDRLDLTDSSPLGRRCRERLSSTFDVAVKVATVPVSSTSGISDAALAITFHTMRYVHVSDFSSKLVDAVRRLVDVVVANTWSARERHRSTLRYKMEATAVVVVLPVCDASINAAAAAVVDVGHLRLQNSYVVPDPSGDELLIRFRPDPLLENVTLDLRAVDAYTVDAGRRSSTTDPQKWEMDFANATNRCPLLKEKVDGTLEWSRDPPIASSAAVWSVCGRVWRVHGQIDRRQFGIVSEIVRSNLRDRETSSMEVRCAATDAMPPIVAEEALSSPLLRFYLEMNDVALECVVSDDVDPSVDGVGRALWTVARSEWTFERDSKRAWVFEGRLHDAAASDTRDGIPGRKVFRCASSTPEGSRVPVHLRYDAEETTRRWSLVLDGARVVAALDWWTTALEFFAAEHGAPNGDASLPSKKSEREDGMARPSDVTVVVADSSVVFPEDSDIPEANAFVLRLTAALTYRPLNFLAPLSCSLQRVEVVSRVPGEDDDVSASVVKPTTVNVDVTALPSSPSRDLCSSWELGHVLHVSAKTVDFGVSFRDARALQRLFSTLGKEAERFISAFFGQPTKDGRSPSRARSLEEDNNVRPVRDERKERFRTSREICSVLDETTALISEDAVPICDAFSVQRNRSLTATEPVRIARLQVTIDDAFARLVDDGEGTDVPWIELAASGLDAEHVLSESAEGRATARLSGRFFDRVLSGWQSLVEPWRASWKWKCLPRPLGHSWNVDLKGEDIVNVNVTKAFFDGCRALLDSWTEGDDATAGDEKGGHCSRKRIPFFPFALKNATGCPLKFAAMMDSLDRASEGGEDALCRDGIRVMPDTVIPFRGAPERGLRSFENGHAVHRIVVHVDGWHPTTPVTVDDFGTFYRNLRAETSENLDTRIVVLVTSWKNVRKLVTVSSALELRNRLQSSADVQLRRAGSRGGDLVVRRSLAPGENWAVPLQHVTSDVLVRPENDPLLAPEVVRWRCVTPPGDVRETCLAMMRTVPVSRKYRLFVRVHRRRSQRDFDSAECCDVVTLLPPVTLINLLPAELVYEVRGEDGSRGRIPRGRRAVLHEVDLSSGLSLGLSFSTFRIPRDLRLPKNSPSFETDLRAEDLEGRALLMTCRVVGIHPGSSLEIYLSARFWFVNKTGLPLIVRQEDVRSVAAGQYADHEMGSTSEPLPFSFSGIAPRRCVLRLGRRSLDDREPPWSTPFPLDGNFRYSCVRDPSSRQSVARSYEIGIEVDAGRRTLKDVSIVTLVPRFCIYNNSFFHLQITQKCALVQLNFRKNLTSLGSDCCLPFYWPYPDRQRLLCVRAEGIGDRWSGGFPIDEVASFHVNIRSDDDLVLYLRVEVIHRGASYDVILTDDREAALPIRIDNRSGVFIACRQDPSEGRAAWTMVPPYASVPYVPDEPKLSPKLRCRAPGGSSVVYDLARVGVAKDGLSYRDAFYVAFAVMASSSGDGDRPEDEEPVLDVSDEGIAILNKKVPGKASQMWTFKGDAGLLENLGSLIDDSGLRETCLCLDVAGTAVDPYHPLPLTLREEDVGRSNTQVWHFSRDGRLHCSLPNFCVQCERTASGFGIGRAVVLAPSARTSRVPSSQAVRRQSILAEPGRLRVSIGHEGPTRVLQVDHVWDEETNSDDDYDHDDASAYDEVDSGVAAEEATGDESEGEHDLRISVSFPRGIGVSIVGSGLEELVYAVLGDVWILIVQSSSDEIWTGAVRRLQVDDSLLGVAWPVLLCTMDEDAGRGHEAFRPAVGFRIRRAIEIQGDALVLNSIFLEHGNFAVKMDELLLWKLLQFFDYRSIENEGFDDVVENVWEKKRNLLARAVGMARRYYVDTLHMSSGSLRVSLATSRYLTPELKAMKRRSGWILAGFEDVHVAFAPLHLKHLYGTGPILMESISKHYRQELRENSVYLKIVGALDILGNPLGLVADVSEGISAAFRRGDVGKLAKNVTHGISDSATKVTETLSEGVGLCALDAQHQETRRKIRREHRSGGGGKALVGGLKGLGHGLVGGVTSIVTRTYEGAVTGGVSGVVVGFGKGVVGTVAKPAAGMLDLASSTAEAVRETSRGGGGDRRPVPLRRRRRCSGPCGLLLDYSEADAQAQELLLTLGERDCGERLVASEVLRSGKYDVLRILVSCTNIYVVKFQELKSEGREVVKVNLRDVHRCAVTTVMDGTTENCFLELSCTSPGLPGTTSGICSLKYHCDDRAAAQRASFTIAYAKKYDEERLYALLDAI